MVMHRALLARVQQIEHDKIREDARDVPRQACRDAGNIEGILHLCRYIPIQRNASGSVKCLIRSSNYIKRRKGGKDEIRGAPSSAAEKQMISNIGSKC